MKYILNRFSVFLAILTIVAAISFSEYRNYQITRRNTSKLSEACHEHNVYAVMLIPRKTWISQLVQQFTSFDNINYSSVDAIEIIQEQNHWPSNGIPEIAQDTINMWDISEIRFPALLPEQKILDELRTRFPSVKLIGPDNQPIL